MQLLQDAGSLRLMWQTDINYKHNEGLGLKKRNITLVCAANFSISEVR